MSENYGKSQGSATRGPPGKQLKECRIISTAIEVNCLGNEVLDGNKESNL